MKASDEIHEWWAQTLLGEQTSAHPVFGRSIKVHVEGPVVTLTGEVEDVDEAKSLEREARQISSVETVVNHLTVRTPEAPEHMQTVIAVFKDKETAQLACRTVSEATTREEDPPELLLGSERSRSLQESIDRAQVPAEYLGKFQSQLEHGKVLLMDRVPEDDVFQIVSALEGTPAESILTLPPEPDFYEEQ